MAIPILESISGQLRDAASDPSAWSTALGSIDLFLNGSGAVLLSVDERLRHAPCSSNLAEMMEDYVANGWYANDLREACCPLLRRQSIVMDYDFQDMERFERTAFYGDFLAKHDRKWFAGLGVDLDGDLWCLALQRSADKGPFQRSESASLFAIQRLLSATAAQFRNTGRAWIDGALRALQDVDRAALVLDRRGQVLHLNSAAKALIGFCLDRHGFLRLPDPRAAQALNGLLLAFGKNGGSSALGHKICSPLVIGDRAFEMETTPLLKDDLFALSRAFAFVRIVPSKLDAASVLKNRYKLTQAELRVAAALLQGSSVREIASRADISPETVRKQLKAIFVKTQTGSQSQLVAFMNRIEAAFAD